jgi:hypothetical protein
MKKNEKNLIYYYNEGKVYEIDTIPKLTITF